MSRAPHASTLLVVLGAGASYDSLPSAERALIPQDIYAEWHPPLAEGLFESRESFGQILDQIHIAAGLIGELRPRIADGAPLEQELERVQEAANEDPRLQRELMGLRRYLQEVLWRCGSKWRDLSHGITNYVSLVRRLDKWARKINGRISYVTFNYDLLLDDAISTYLRLALDTVDGYVSHPLYTYIKLHGSVNWWRSTNHKSMYPTASQAWEVLLDELPSIEATDEFVVRPIDATPGMHSVEFPAIAVPFETKLSYECPSVHEQILVHKLRDVDRILIVGWKGAEQHFLRTLDENVRGKAPPIEIVGGSETGTEETASNLARAGLSLSRMHRNSDGFGSYLSTMKLEEFLFGGPRMVVTATGWQDLD